MPAKPRQLLHKPGWLAPARGAWPGRGFCGGARADGAAAAVLCLLVLLLLVLLIVPPPQPLLQPPPMLCCTCCVLTVVGTPAATPAAPSPTLLDASCASIISLRTVCTAPSSLATAAEASSRALRSCSTADLALVRSTCGSRRGYTTDQRINRHEQPAGWRGGWELGSSIPPLLLGSAAGLGQASREEAAGTAPPDEGARSRSGVAVALCAAA